MSHDAPIQQLILRRVVPLALLSLLAVVGASRWFAGHILRGQVETRLELASTLKASQVAGELENAQAFVRSLADNHLIVNAIVNKEQRQTQLPPFFRSLRMPSAAFRRITMTDYQGRPLVSNLDASHIELNRYMDALSAGMDVLEVNEDTILVACPIVFSSMKTASMEGILAAEYDTRELLDRLRASSISRRFRVLLKGTEIYSDWGKAPSDLAHSSAEVDWIASRSPIPGHPEIVVEQSEYRETAFAVLRSLDYFLFGVFALSATAIGGTIFYSSRILTQPLAELIDQIGRIENQQGLANRISIRGPKELQMLTTSFNRMMTDLSATTVSLDEMEITKNLLQVALHGGNIGMWSWDVEANTVVVSEELSGQVGEQVAFDSYDTFIARLHPDDVASTQRAVEHCFRGLLDAYDCTFRLRHKDGSYRWILSRGRVVQFINGEPRQMVGVHVDITQRIESEQQLRRANKELARSNEELAQFAYIASHDLQEPLRKVISFANLLEEEASENLTEENLLFLSHIVDGAQRMRTLIRDLLAFSRVESDGHKPEPTNAASALQASINDLQLTIDDTLAEIHCDVMPTVMAESQQLTQLFTNLISNAMKYCEKQPKLKIVAETNDTECTITICDNGIGIAPEFREKVFGIFKRLHGREVYSGNGIGLAICKRIVDRFGGRIWADLNPETGGTCIRFTLPIAAEVHAAPKMPLTMPQATATKTPAQF